MGPGLLRGLLVVVVALGVCRPETPRPAPSSIRALDGDTLALPGGDRVRLVHVDTPERGRGGAEEARAYSQRFVESGLPTLSRGDSRRDRYGRRLADVTVAGRSLSAALVEHGLAWIYPPGTSALREAQCRAVEARLGVHAGLDDLRLGPLVATASRFHRVTCPVIGRRAGARPWSGTAAEQLMRGRAPCRTCLPWPPREVGGGPASLRDRLLGGG